MGGGSAGQGQCAAGGGRRRTGRGRCPDHAQDQGAGCCHGGGSGPDPPSPGSISRGSPGFKRASSFPHRMARSAASTPDATVAAPSNGADGGPPSGRGSAAGTRRDPRREFYHRDPSPSIPTAQDAGPWCLGAPHSTRWDGCLSAFGLDRERILPRGGTIGFAQRTDREAEMLGAVCECTAARRVVWDRPKSPPNVRPGTAFARSNLVRRVGGDRRMSAVVARPGFGAARSVPSPRDSRSLQELDPAFGQFELGSSSCAPIDRLGQIRAAAGTGCPS